MILARAKKKDSDELVKGWYRYNKYYDIHLIDVLFIDEKVENGHYWKEHEIDPTTLAYDTLRTDKNGTPIFGAVEGSRGGDKITFIPADGFGTKLKQTAMIYYCTARAAFCVKSKAWDMPLKHNCEDIEIIGNGLEKK